MATLLIALGAGVAFLMAYHTYGRWLGRRVFQLAADAVCPSAELRDDRDYVPTPRSVVFGHHFTSIAGTGPIVGPAIAVMWGWLPALLWVVLGSIFIGAVHDFGSLVVSLRNRGQTVGEIAGRVINRRVRLLFLLVLFLALTIVLAIFGLVIAAVFKQYPAAIVPCLVQIPVAVAIGFWLHRRGTHLLLPSLSALGLMYLAVVFGDVGVLGNINAYLASLSIITWVIVLLIYSYVASVLPVWSLLQPRDYINSLQLVSVLLLIVAGLVVAAFVGGAPPVPGAERQPLQIIAPVIDAQPEGAPPIYPFLFITIACGAISGFHCLVSSGTSSKQLKRETDAQLVGFGSMLTEGFLAVLVILCCVAGLGLGIEIINKDLASPPEAEAALEWFAADGNFFVDASVDTLFVAEAGVGVWQSRYASWQAAGGLAKTVGAFVDGSANLLKALGLPPAVAVALMGVFVASFAGTTLDTACRLQRYVVQELARALSPANPRDGHPSAFSASSTFNPIVWLTNKHAATIFAILIAAAIAATPAPGGAWGWASAGQGGLILWPMFGATNQLLGGLAFLVIAFWLWRRNKPVWFIGLPLVFMLIMPAWAMLIQIPDWWNAPQHGEPRNWPLLIIAGLTLLLEAWMIVEAVRLFPRVRGVAEADASRGQATG
jgi:carbon starvation protein